MKKGFRLFIVFLITLVALFSLSAAIFTPTIPPTCSENDIKTVWDSIFRESSSGITIFTNTTQNGRCNGYLAYKIQGDKGDILVGLDAYRTISNTTEIIAFDGNFTQDYINIVKNSSTFQNYTTLLYYIYQTPASRLQSSVKPRNISLIDASPNYTLSFKADAGTFSQFISSGITYYYSNQTELNVNYSNTLNGIVTGNYSLNYVDYFKEYYNLLPACTSNWAALNTSCISDDSYIIWYNDTASCGNSSRPANVTMSCDYDHNGIIGNISHSSLSSISLDWYVNSNAGNLSSIFNTSKTVELREGNITRVIFDYPFSSSLNFKTLVISKQPSSSSYGYLAVSGLSGMTKTFTIDKLMANSTKVCVLNKEATISNITTGCDSEWEYLFNCPGNFGSYFCNVTDNKLVVSGLTNSVVAEYIGNSNTSACTESWTCINWTSCSAGTRTRTCIDAGNCGTISSRPALSETCTETTTLAVCKTNWTCSSWPTACPSNGIQTRTCVDTNRCKSPLDLPRPELSQQCTNETNWTIIIIITAIALVIIIGIIYFIMKSMSPKGSESYVNVQNFPRTPPSSSQFMPQRPVQQPRPFQPQLPSQPKPFPSQPRPSGTNPLPAQPQRFSPPSQSPPPSQPENQDNKKVDFEF